MTFKNIYNNKLLHGHQTPPEFFAHSLSNPWKTQEIVSITDKRLMAPYQKKIFNDIQSSLRPTKEERVSLFSKRTWAFAIDLMCIILLNKAVIFSFQNFLRTFYYQLQYSTQFMLEQNMGNIAGVTFIIIYFGYFQASYYMGEGKTPGKHFMGLSVYSSNFVNTGELHLSLKESFMRTVGHLISIVFIIPLAMPLLNRKRKSLSDLLSQTEIITEEQMEFYVRKYDEIMNESSENLHGREYPEDQDLQLELDLNFEELAGNDHSKVKVADSYENKTENKDEDDEAA